MTSDTLLRRVAQGGATYVVVGAVQRGLPFLLLPLYTRQLNASEYGVVVSLLALNGFLTIAFSGGMETPLLRLRALPDDRGSVQAIRAVLAYLSWVPPVVSCLVGAVVVAVDIELFAVPSNILAMELVAAAIAARTLAGNMAIIRASERFSEYAQCAVVGVVTLGAAQVAFVVILDRGVIGWAIADLLAAVVSRGFSSHVARMSVGPSDLKWTALRPSIVFGMPLVPHLLSHWALSLSDRFVILAVLGPASLGMYGAAYQLASGLGILFSELNRATMPAYVRASAGGPVELMKLGPLATMYLLIVLWASTSLAIMSDPLVKVVLPVSYAETAIYVPMISIGFAFFGLYFIPMNCLSLYLGKTTGIWRSTLFAALVNVGLNIILLEEFGVAVAAMNTAIGYSVLCALVWLRWKREGIAKLPIIWPAIGIGALVCLLGIASVTLMPNHIVGLQRRSALVVMLGLLAFLVWRRLVVHRLK